MHLRTLNSLLTTFFIIMLFSSFVFAKPSPELGMSETEQLWLENHSIIRLAPDIAWPPFEWVDGDQQYQGIAADYIHLVEKKLGIEFVVEREKPWSEVVAAVKTHQLDMFSCVAKNSDRLEYVNFTRPYLSFPMVMVTTTEISHIDGIKGLLDLQVGVVKDYATHEYFKTNRPTIPLTLFDNAEEGLKAVSQGKIQVFVDNIATATSLMQTKGLTNLKISGEMPIRYELGMAVRKDWPEFIPILQKALDSITSKQRKEIHNKWIGVRYEHSLNYDLFLKSLAIFALIIGLFYFYIRKLAREVNQRKRAEKLAITARNEADRANQAKSEFLSVMSHELRTPLTSIKGALGLLVSGRVADLPENVLGMLNIANRNSDRLIILINDILDIEKLLAGKMDFHNENVIIGDLVRYAISSNQDYADQFGVSFDVAMNDCESAMVFTDENRLMQVFANLLSNAIKYSPKGDSVHIDLICKNQKVRVSVTDQGKGVPADFQKHIFSHFSQADSSDTREKGGTGLGLAISKEIIERLGGCIGFTSTPGEGASFYFELDTMQIEHESDPVKLD